MTIRAFMPGGDVEWPFGPSLKEQREAANALEQQLAEDVTVSAPGVCFAAAVLGSCTVCGCSRCRNAGIVATADDRPLTEPRPASSSTRRWGGREPR